MTKFVMPSTMSPVLDDKGRLAPVWQAYFRGIEELSQHLHIAVGNPENVEAAGIGELYLRQDGGASTVLYVKESDDGLSSGWTAK